MIANHDITIMPDFTLRLYFVVEIWRKTFEICYNTFHAIYIAIQYYILMIKFYILTNNSIKSMNN